ncbi:MAG: ParA family protein [Methylophaga sp.]|nr:ParA family protein [Methylophaga sp.]
MSQRRVIAIMNQQAGVGKTTTCMHLGRAFVALNQPSLMIDLCPDASLSKQLGLDAELGMAEAMMGTQLPVSTTIESQLSVVPAGQQLEQIEQSSGLANGLKLNKLLDNLSGQISFILIDCPDSDGMLNANALLAADEILIPVTPQQSAWQGLAQMMPVMRRLRRLNRKPLFWLLLNAVPDEPKIIQAYCDMLSHYFKASVLRTVIYDFSQQKPEAQTERYKALATDLLYGRTM